MATSLQLSRQKLGLEEDANRIKAKEADVKADLAKAQKTRMAFQNAKDFMSGLSDATKAAATAGMLNDWTWYVPTVDRAKDVASFPFGIPYGTLFNPKFTNEFDSTTVHGGAETEFSAPSICTMCVAQTLGGNSGAWSDVQRAAERLFDQINKNTGRNADYEGADVLQMMVALASLHSYHSFLKRAYKCLTAFQPTNDYAPRRFLANMGLDYDDLKDNIYDFKGHINWLADQLHAYPVIPGITLFNRWSFEMSHIFKDMAGDKVQYYMFVPRHFYKLIVSDGPTEVKAQSWAAGNASTIPNHTFEDVLAFTDNLLQGIIGMSDARMLRSDIMKAYGSEVFPTIEYVHSEDKMEFSVDHYALMQFKNAILVGNHEAEWYDIRQDTNGYIWTDSIYIGNDEGTARVPTSFTIQTPFAEPDFIDVLEGTRLVPSVEVRSISHAGAVSGNGPCVVGFMHTVAEWVHVESFKGYYTAGDYNRGIFGGTTDTNYIDFGDISSIPYYDVTPVLNILANAKSFSYFPVLYISNGGQNNENATLHRSMYCDWDNYTVVDSSDIRAINNVAAYYMFTIANAE